MEELIRRTLDHCGYHEDSASEENLKQCFLDYCDCSQFGNLDLETVKDLIEEGEITVKDMCYNLLKR